LIAAFNAGDDGDGRYELLLWYVVHPDSALVSASPAAASLFSQALN
jgi:hypothetical protein